MQRLTNRAQRFYLFSLRCVAERLNRTCVALHDMLESGLNSKVKRHAECRACYASTHH